MKKAIKFCLIIAPLISASLYSSQEPKQSREGEFYGKIFSEWLIRTNNLDPETLVKVQQEENERVATELATHAAQGYMHWNKPVPMKTILQANAEVADAARAHNKKLSEQLAHAQQPK